MLRRIILPSAFRRALPAYGNEVIFMLHGSAVASVVTILDLTGAAGWSSRGPMRPTRPSSPPACSTWP